MTSELETLWPSVAARLRAERGWLLRPLARLGRPRDDRCTWLPEGEPGAVIVKPSSNAMAAERAAWTGETLARHDARGVPVPL